MKIEPYRLCHRFDRCSVNACPLDPIQRFTHPSDKERKCTVEKQVRLRISKSFPDLLPKVGLTAAEWAGKQAYEAKPPSVKSAMVERAKMVIRQVNAKRNQPFP